jgi:hypothetical protein
MPDPKDQVKYFNYLVAWRSSIDAPLHRHTRFKQDTVNPWFSLNIKRAMMKRNIANAVFEEKEDNS